MATHSSTLAWQIPWTEGPGRLQSMGCKESDMTERLNNNNEVCHNFSSKEQVSFNFMAAVTICRDFAAPPKIKSDTVSTVSPSISHEVMGPDAMILVF